MNKIKCIKALKEMRNISQKRAGKKEEKTTITFKSEKYRPKRKVTKKKSLKKQKLFRPTDRPTHVLATEGQYNKFLF